MDEQQKQDLMHCVESRIAYYKRIEKHNKHLKDINMQIYGMPFHELSSWCEEQQQEHKRMVKLLKWLKKQ